MAEQFYRKAADQQGTGRWPETCFHQAMILARLGQANDARRIDAELRPIVPRQAEDIGSFACRPPPIRTFLHHPAQVSILMTTDQSP